MSLKDDKQQNGLNRPGWQMDPKAQPARID